MQTGKSDVRSMFDGSKIFKVPIYQRAYSWQVKDNLADYLSDLLNQPEDQPYFFGSFLLHLQGNKNDFKLIDVVDGQQRITTFCIFINELISQLQTRDSSIVGHRARRMFLQDDDVYKIEVDNEDNSFVHNAILADSPTSIEPRTASQRLMLEAKDYFSRKFEEFELNSLEKIYRVSTKADVLLYVVDKINAATQIFELLNDRGRRLTDLEAIKSFMMYNAGLTSENADQAISDVQHDFGAIYRICERYGVPEQDVLRYHCIAFEACPEAMREYPKAFLKTKISASCKTKKAEALRSIRELSARLRKSFELFGILQEEKSSSAALGTVFMIGRVAPFFPLMMKALSESRERYELLLKTLIKFTFRASLIGLRSNGISYLYTSLRNNEDYIAKLDSFVECNWWNINQRAENEAQLQNYYDWISKNIVRYVLVKYENQLRSRKGFPLLGYEQYFTNQVREKLSIEHISAQRAKGIQYDAEFEDRYMHSIGNLVIDCAASNSSKGSNNTSDKKEAYVKAPIMSQNEIGHEAVDWTKLDAIKEFIRNREKHMQSYVLRILKENMKEEIET